MAELIVALDLGSIDDPLRVVDQLPGLEWANHQGPEAAAPRGLAAVSVLTSHAPEGYWRTAGNRGTDIKATAGPDCWIIVPAIRPGGAPAGDQRRTADPLTAVKAGATHLVAGRPMTRAERPCEVYNNSIRKDLG